MKGLPLIFSLAFCCTIKGQVLYDHLDTSNSNVVKIEMRKDSLYVFTAPKEQTEQTYRSYEKRVYIISQEGRMLLVRKAKYQLTDFK